MISRLKDNLPFDKNIEIFYNFLSNMTFHTFYFIIKSVNFVLVKFGKKYIKKTAIKLNTLFSGNLRWYD